MEPEKMRYHIRGRGEIKVGEELADVKSISPGELKPSPRGTGLAMRDWLAIRAKGS